MDFIDWAVFIFIVLMAAIAATIAVCIHA